MGFRKGKSSARLSRSHKPIKKRPPGQIGGLTTGSRTAEDFRDLSLRILHYPNRPAPVADFLREASKMILEFSGCDSVGLRLKEGDSYFHCEARRRVKQSFLYELIPPAQKDEGVSSSGWRKDSALERLCDEILNRRFDSSLPFLTKKGSFWTGNTKILLNLDPKTNGKKGARSVSIGGHNRSLALIPLFVGNETIGLLQLRSRRRGYFTENEIELYEDLAQDLGIAVVNQRVHAASNERVKELTCLYGIAKAAERPEIPLEKILQRIVGFLPPAWQYPEIAFGRIILGGVSYSTPGFQDSRQKQSATITVKGKKRGVVEVVYAEKKPKLDEGPFLKEERSLIDAVARQVALLIERRETEEDRSNLQSQLRHADRLATIGQLAAGVAHELNEPLGNILGFAQLAQKCQGLSKQAEKDIEQIVSASLHAREVIKKLLLTARQMPPRKTHVNLNQVVKDGLYLFEARCAKEGIEVARSLSRDLPEITADPGQLNQVLVNLVVNSVQAMPEGGRLTVQTLSGGGHVSLVVEDTGVGMSEEIMEQIFIPFFTTKNVNQGTGLGLAVVHGIVTSHGGSIKVESHVDRGTRFEVQLPLTTPQETTEGSSNDLFD